MLKLWLNKDKRMIGKLIVAPVIAVMFICIITSNIYVEDLPVAIANLDDSSLSRRIVAEFESHSGFAVTEYLNSESELMNAVYRQRVVAGLLIPSGYGSRVAQMDGAAAMLLLDGTNSTTAGSAQGYATGIFNALGSEIQVQAMQDAGASDQSIRAMSGIFAFTDRIMYNQYGSFLYHIIYMIMPYMIQMQYLCFFLFPLLWEERESGRLAKRGNGQMIFRIFAMCALMCCTTYVAMLIGSMIFHFPVSANFPLHFVLMLAYSLALTAVAFVISLFTGSGARFYMFELFCIIGVLIMLTSGFVWPEFKMPWEYPVIVRTLWPFARVAMPFKALHLKGAGWAETLPAVGSCLMFGVCWLAVGLAIMALRKGALKAADTDGIMY